MRTILSICVSTAKSLIRDRVFYAALIFSLMFIGFCYFLSTLTIIESRKILLDFGMGAISQCGIGMGLFLGVTLIRLEIDKRTIYSILSKPVMRGEYVLGKFLGGAIAALLVQAITSFTLVVTVFYIGEEIPNGLGAALFLMYLESVLIMAIGLLFSTCFSSFMLGTSLSIAVFLIGRSSLALRKMAEGTKSEFSKLLFKGMYGLFPNLDRFNIRDLVAYGKPYPEYLVLTSCAYFLCYVSILLLLNVLSLRRKDFN